jgi:DNA-binding PadR family transcriptional regulator
MAPDTFQILVSLADRERHGYSVMHDIAERTNGAVRLSPSSLYAAIKRLLEQGLIEELAERPDPAHDDERRRYYRLTKPGRQAAMAEARRLDRSSRMHAPRGCCQRGGADGGVERARFPGSPLALSAEFSR